MRESVGLCLQPPNSFLSLREGMMRERKKEGKREEKGRKGHDGQRGRK